jgi:catechol 2,3-dioxygenase-like lactoylglutathione lyase family enzyme
MKATALLRLGRNVSQLESVAAFYQRALGFQPVGPAAADPLLAAILGLERVILLRLRLGAQEIELSECFPKGAAYPMSGRANDLFFQHIAIVTQDISASCGQVVRLGAEAISRNGPAQLPASSGGVSAFKFRDPDGHPLEFLQFPDRAACAAAEFDHSAISVSNIARTTAFFAELGLVVRSQQVNHGPEQDALDGLPDVTVDVVALQPARPSPHVELLGYRSPNNGLALPYSPADICADRLIFGAADGGLRLLRDPDGHVILLDGR